MIIYMSEIFLFSNLINQIINNKNKKIIILILRMRASYWQ
jgi:hypothetical protein